jgi:hypothetical protein
MVPWYRQTSITPVVVPDGVATRGRHAVALADGHDDAETCRVSPVNQPASPTVQACTYDTLEPRCGRPGSR